MNNLTSNFIDVLGKSIDSKEVNALFDELQTMHRPSFDADDDEQDVYEWVLVKRKGIELGFVDKNYYLGLPYDTWYQEGCLLAQVYFYQGLEGIEDCLYPLPFNLDWKDSREQAIEKMRAFSDSHRASFTDVWEIDNILLTINYDEETNLVDRVVCQLILPSLPTPEDITPPDLTVLTEYLDEDINTPEFIDLWEGYIDKDMISDAYEDEEIDLISNYGVKIETFEQEEDEEELLLYSIKFYANREADSAGWQGKLPFDIEFSDSPNQLFQKVNYEPDIRRDDVDDGYAVWKLEDYTLHVLYSNFTNKIKCVTIMSSNI